ncbi:MAG: DUF4492 domain-containing protein [Bacteroidales bacterium]|nr:DUF4492 domain-containing protein [Bacteroidales bacterium]
MSKKKAAEGLGKVVNFYIEGFRNMTWGRTLWALVLLKVFILFAILRLVFFRPAMAGKTDAQKSEMVAELLTEQPQKPINKSMTICYSWILL